MLWGEKQRDFAYLAVLFFQWACESRHSPSVAFFLFGLDDAAKTNGLSMFPFLSQYRSISRWSSSRWMA